MGRQRVLTHTSPLAWIGRVILVLVCLALVWYGLMVLLLALGVIGGGSADLVSGLYTGFDAVTGISTSDITGTIRLIAGIAGLLAFLIFGYLALKEIPRPSLARHRLELGEDDRGTVAVQPRAVERAAEGAALEHPSVASASSRYSDDDLHVDVSVRQARDVPDTLRDVQRRVTEALGRHDLPAHPVSVTLTGYDPEQPQREIA